ncbi:MAG: TIGR04283 family arsenosugar biosynthesis glycosyltransferase [Gemmatimonadetes bacterium]|nr:TIGR04283 family arsenosugar biosynthesis glycosyltransferase [Gemmatimonadota bacterium]
MISVVIPTVNEAPVLPALLDDLRELARAVPLEVVVVDGGSSDGTPARAAAGGARVLHAPRGRASQLNSGAMVARGEWLLFLHADCRLDPGTPRALLPALEPSAGVQAAVFRFAIDLPRFWRHFIEAGQAVREALSGLAYGDQGLLIRRDLFAAVGGYPDLPLMEDVAMICTLRRRIRVARLPAPLVTSGRRYRRGGVLRTWLKHTALISLYLIGASPTRLARWRDGV